MRPASSIGALSSARDITEHAEAERRRAQVEETLRASEMHLRTLAETVPLGIDELDLRGPHRVRQPGLLPYVRRDR